MRSDRYSEPRLNYFSMSLSRIPLDRFHSFVISPQSTLPLSELYCQFQFFSCVTSRPCWPIFLLSFSYVSYVYVSFYPPSMGNCKKVKTSFREPADGASRGLCDDREVLTIDTEYTSGRIELTSILRQLIVTFVALPSEKEAQSNSSARSRGQIDTPPCQSNGRPRFVTAFIHRTGSQSPKKSQAAPPLSLSPLPDPFSRLTRREFARENTSSIAARSF